MAALFLRKTPWINSRLQQFFIACVQNTLLPEKNSKNYSLKLVGWSSFFLRRPHKLMKFSPMIWHHIVNCKYTMKILSICVAFFKTLTLTKQCMYIHSIFTLWSGSGNLKGTFEGQLMTLRDWTQWFFTTEQILFEIAFNIYTIFEEF